MKPCNGKLWATLNEGEFEVRSLVETELEEALNVLDDSFFLNESVCIACEINLPANIQSRQELRELCRITAQDGVSLVVKHVPSGRIVSVSFNKIQSNGEEDFFLDFRNEQTKSPQALRLMDFMIEVDEQYDICAKFNMNCYCELMFLATLPNYERKGLAFALAKYTIELTQEFGRGVGLADIAENLRELRPKAVTALWTSSFSQKVGKKAGFKVLNTVHYASFTYNGKQFNERIGELHKFCEHVAFVF